MPTRLRDPRHAPDCARFRWTVARVAPDRPERRTGRSPLTLLLLGLAIAGAIALAPPTAKRAAAQTNGAAPTEAEQTEPEKTEPAFVAMSDIGVESERAKRRMKESRRILEPSDEAEAVSAAIPELQRRVNVQLERSAAVRGASPSVLTLDRLQKEWDEIRGQISRTQDLLRRRGKEIDDQVESVRTTRALWTSTRAKSIELGVSPDVIGQIDEVLEVVAAATLDANQRQATVLGLQSDVESLSEQAAGDVALIAEARNDAVGEVFKRDVAPIWSTDFWQSVEPATIGAQLASQEERDVELLSKYWAKHRDLVITYAVLTAMLVMGVYATRRRIDARLAEEDDLAPVRAIFRRPIALSLLISFFASLWVFDELVVAFEPVFGAATLIPAVVVLRQIVDRPLFPLLTVAMLVYIAHQFQDLLTEAQAVSRLVFLAEMLTLVVFTTLSLRPARLAAIAPEMARSRMFRVVGFGLHATLVVAGLSFIAESVGYGALARLVGGALVMSIYAAIVLYGTVRVLDGMVAYLLHVRPLRLLGMVSRHQWLIRHRVQWVLQLGAWFIWSRAVLRGLELWDDLEVAWASLLASELPFPQITMTVGHVVTAGLVFWIAMLFSRFVQFALAEDVFSRMSLERGRPYAISTLLHYTLLILGFVLAAAALGFDANRATLLTGAFGVGIGFGLQTIVNNFISGIILLTERPIQVGDTIAMGEVFGEVQRIGIRSSTVRTWQGAEVIVPNADLIAQQVTNWTKSDQRRRIEIPVGVKYGTDPQTVMDTLLRAAQSTDLVLEDPGPYVIFTGFGDSSVNYEVRAWTDAFDSFLSVKTRLGINVIEMLGEAGVEIPFPQRDVYLKPVSGEGTASGDSPGEAGAEAGKRSEPSAVRPTGPE